MKPGLDTSRWFQAYVDRLPMAEWEYDGGSHRLTVLSTAVETLGGYRVSEWLEPGFLDRAVPPDERARARQACRDAKSRGEDVLFDFRTSGPDGQSRTVRALVLADDGEASRSTYRGILLEIPDPAPADDAGPLTSRMIDPVRRLEMLMLMHGGDWSPDAASAEERARLRRTEQRYEKKLRHLAHRLVAAENRERRELAEDLHDRVAQNLAVARMRMTEASRAEDPELAEAKRRDALRLIDDAIRETRSVTRELSPLMLPGSDLIAALNDVLDDLQTRFGLACELQTDGALPELDQEVAAFVCRTVRELLVNVVKHSGSYEARASIAAYDEGLVLEVSDDGVGLEQSPGLGVDGRFGLVSIRERAEAMGGSLVLSGGPDGRGTLARIYLPSTPETLH